MMHTLMVGIGGFLGSVARYGLDRFIPGHSAGLQFPLGTLVVNISGCLAIGVLAGLFESRTVFTADIRLFLLTGILGGFTTFSAFGLETVFLLRRGEIGVAILYVTLSVAVGLAAVWLGLQLFGASGGGARA